MDPKILVREVLEEHAPEEVFLLDSYSPTAKSGGAAFRGPLGFGIESPAVLLLPILYSIFDSFLKDIGKQASTELVGLVRRLATQKSNPALDARAKAKSLIIEEFTKAGLGRDQSDDVADKVVAIMAKQVA